MNITPNDTVILASENPIKLQAVIDFFNIPKKNIFIIETTLCKDISLQPIGIYSGNLMCRKKIEYIRESLKLYNSVLTSGFIIAIENYICGHNNYKITEEYCEIMIYKILNGSCVEIYCGKSKPIQFSDNYFHYAVEKSELNSISNEGMKISIGNSIKSFHSYIDPNNWMEHREFNLNFHENGYTSKIDQIIDAFIDACKNVNNSGQFIYIKNILNSRINCINNYPKPGIILKDLTNIISNKNSFKFLIELMKHTLDKNNVNNIDKIIGLELNGIIYGSALANKINAGFISGKKIFNGEFPINTYDRVLIIDEYIIINELISITEKVTSLGGKIVGYLGIFSDENTEKNIGENLFNKVPKMIIL